MILVGLWRADHLGAPVDREAVLAESRFRQWEAAAGIGIDEVFVLRERRGLLGKQARNRRSGGLSVRNVGGEDRLRRFRLSVQRRLATERRLGMERRLDNRLDHGLDGSLGGGLGFRLRRWAHRGEQRVTSGQALGHGQAVIGRSDRLAVDRQIFGLALGEERCELEPRNARPHAHAASVDMDEGDA